MKIIEEKKYTLKIHELLVETIYPENTVLDEIITKEIDDILTELNPGKKYYILSEARGFYMISPGLRKAMATADFNRPIAAIAFYSQEEKLNDMQQTFNEITQPKVPIKFFINKEKAIKWLTEIKNPA